MWDNWQRHLGAPQLTEENDGSFSLLSPNRSKPSPFPAWIYVFEPDATSSATPSPITLRKMIGTNAPSISYWALEVAPEAALSNIDAEAGFLAALSRRLKEFWPELAKTVIVEVPIDEPTGTKRGKVNKKREVKMGKLESESGYAGPTDDAVRNDEPDEGER